MRRPTSSLLLLFVLAACGDIDVRSVRVPEVVPAALEGEWSGTWTSSRTNASGPLTVRVQEFDGQPLLSVDIENACVENRSYDLVLGNGLIELRDGARTVFAGVLGEGRTLLGTFTCDADDGTWTAAWQRDLPPLVDLSGTWNGSLATLENPQRGLRLQLDQGVRGGVLVLDGTMAIAGLGPDGGELVVPLEGAASFRSDGFDLGLRSLGGITPNLVLSGLGDPDPLQVEVGVLQVLGASSLPFSQGVFRILWSTP